MESNERTHAPSLGDLAASWRERAVRVVSFRPRETLALAVAGLVVIAVATAGFVRARPADLTALPPPAVPAADSEDEAAAEPALIYIHVAGAVRRPGVYSFPAGARAVDAIEAAGGTTADADADAINLARPLSDGERLYVPREGEEPPPDAGGANGATADGRVNLNTADAGALERLPGIGPVLAQRIVDHRERNGPFRTVHDLLRVEGIGSRKLESLEPHVTV